MDLIIQNIDELTDNALILSKISAFMNEWNNSENYVIAHTSGSTGKPKEIKLLKSDMVASAMLTNRHFGITSETDMLLCLSPDYIAGKLMIVRALVSNAHLYVQEPSNKIDISRHYHFCAIVPSQICAECNKIDTVIVGGGVISTEREQLLLDNHINAYATYGMTETITHVALRKIGENNYHALGDITFSTDSRQCLCISVPHLSIAHVDTNDIVELYDNLTFRWIGRYDNVINSGGIKLYPEEIERKISNVLSRNFYIKGVPDSKWGEIVTLVIEGEYDNEILPQLKLVLSKYEMPKSVCYIPQFNYTKSGKIIRN